MTRSEADRELRRAASSMLRKGGNDPDRALTSFCLYLLDAPTGIFSAFVRATACSTSADNGIEDDARPYLAKLSEMMPRVLT
jgi:hypothetical protein